MLPEQTPPCGQVTQVPPQQVWPDVQDETQVPLAGSQVRHWLASQGADRQTEPHWVVPMGHTQVVPEQTPPCGQVTQVLPQQV